MEKARYLPGAALFCGLFHGTVSKNESQWFFEFFRILQHFCLIPL